MMYLSHLMIDVGGNPDRPRPGRLWLRNIYRVHQRLAMAFPSQQRRSEDPPFLAPYNPQHFPEQRHLADQAKNENNVGDLKQVHARRSDGSGFLFRVDALPGGRAVLLVLSHRKPDWDYAFGLLDDQVDPRTNRPVGNAGYLLAAPPNQPRPFRIALSQGARYRFRLVANPTRKIATVPGRVFQALKVRGEEPQGRHGRRVPVRPEELSVWLVRKGEQHGFRLAEPIQDTLRIVAGYVYINKSHEVRGGQRLRSVRYDGMLEIVDVEKFRTALTSGIGSAKAFGFGLLSVAPL